MPSWLEVAAPMRKSSTEREYFQDQPIRLSGNELQQMSHRRGKDFGDRLKEFRIFAAGPSQKLPFFIQQSERWLESRGIRSSGKWSGAQKPPSVGFSYLPMSS